MDLSVIVTSFNAPRALRRCLEALVAQPEAVQIVVADCSEENPIPSLEPVFPRVEFIRFETQGSVPRMRWDCVPLTTGAIVAALEARCLPEPQWCAKLLQAHSRYPAAPAVGGPVAGSPAAGGWQRALYYCEYARHAPPAVDGPVPDLSSANLSYKRTALDGAVDFLRSGQWEGALHQRWRAAGLELIACSATVAFENTMRFRDTLRQRFWYARQYAAHRTSRAKWRYALLCPALPALLTWRTIAAARRHGLIKHLAPVLGWVTFLHTAWALGEFVGYLAGDSGQERIF
jgi:hypothetical protein